MSTSRMRFGRPWRNSRRQSREETCVERIRSNANFESVQLASTTPAVVEDWLIPLRDDIPCAAATYTCHTLMDFVPLTVITMVYFIFLLPALGLVDAAPTPWSNACGAYVLADEQVSYETVHGADRNRVLCELRGNLTKQVNTLRSYMGPKNFSKVYSKHNKSYAFLNVTRAKNITLRTWHKQLQVYVAAADQLYERAYNYKNLRENTFVSSPEQSNKADKDLQRLRHLIITTRSILCEFELAANLLSKQQMSSDALAIDANKMQQQIMQLRSYKRTARDGVDPIDINMLFHRLRRALLNMRKSLKRRC
ncbi:PREDICTED: uncharacterized protein LOC108371343, partial [Rhagoletis zephyria]|uniref:uncharacterized protein LOC108371343 n=1 Tax=Rhagoletis zephyria TaxID=28612 RepID=UPI00081142D6